MDRFSAWECQMRRREFVTFLGAAGAAWPLAAGGQQSGPMRRVIVLMPMPEGDPGGKAEMDSLANGLRELGWVEGRNIHIEYRWPGGDIDQSNAEIAAVLSAISREVGGGLIVIPDTFLQQRRDVLISLVDHHRLPA